MRGAQHPEFLEWNIIIIATTISCNYSIDTIHDNFQGSKSMIKLKDAVYGKKGNNLDDLPHLDQFIHTYKWVFTKV